MTPRLRDLEVLLAVARQGSFGRAATELLVSQPAVSERIRMLERTVGRPLVERTYRGAVLTPAGEQLAGYAARCLALAEEAVEAVRGADEPPRFVLAGHSTFAARVVPLVFGALTELPRRLVLRDGHSHEVLAFVQDEIADLGVTMASSVPPGVRRLRLPNDAVVCVVAPDHPLAARRRPTLDALRTSLVAVNVWGDGADDAIARLSATIDEWRIRRCADTGTAIALARDHGHVAFVTGSSTAAELRQGTLRVVPLAGLASWTVRTQLVYRTARQDDPAIRAVVEAIRSLPAPAR
jgi:DNA-binding transcriptional LysR family regulator